MNDFDMPATLPGTMKEQLRALAPYMVDHALKSNGGWVANYIIPLEAFVTADFNHNALAEYNMKMCVTIKTPDVQIGGEQMCGRVAGQARYADVELSYK
jgi:hypothetical protein